VLLLCSNSRADEPSSAAGSWSDSFLTRIEALALLQTFQVELLGSSSATLTLEQWCEAHHLAAEPKMVAERVLGVGKPVTPEQRRELKVSPTEVVRYRRVKLRCGQILLSEADNWYVPRRLTREMNIALETTDTPFGKVVQALHFQRLTLSSRLLWQPLPPGWEMQPASAQEVAGLPPMPPAVLEHRALLTLRDGTPFSEVVESYSANVLAFPVPRP
jgi:hypothetical protein